MQLHDLLRQVFTFTQTDQIHKISNGLGIVHSGTTGDDQRCQLGSVSGVHGNAGQVQHIEDGGKGHLVAHGKSHNVKVGDGVAGFQGEQRHICLAHLLFHVAPRGKYTLAPHTGHVVHYAVQNPHAQIGHTDLIGVREAESNAGIHLALVLDDSIIFAAHIACRFLHTW